MGDSTMKRIALFALACTWRPAKYRREQRARCVSWYCLPYGRTTESGLRRHGVPLRFRRNDVLTSLRGLLVPSTRARHVPLQALPARVGACGRERATRRPLEGGAIENSGAAARTMVRTPWCADPGPAAVDGRGSNYGVLARARRGKTRKRAP